MKNLQERANYWLEDEDYPTEENLEMSEDSGDRIKDAVEKAELAFWAEIANEFPEIKTGDFSPDASYELTKSMVDAVKIWLAGNK